MKLDEVKTEIEKRRVDIIKTLPKWVNGDRFVKSAMLCVYNSPELQKCAKESIFECIYTAAQVGLDFSPVKGQAYMIPFKKKVGESTITIATFIPGYRGLIEIARQTGLVIDIQARIVYKNDVFEIAYGSNPTIKHVPCLNGNRGDVFGAYAIAFFKDGYSVPEFMTLKELEAVRKVSKAPDSPAYKSFPDEMRRKAPVRRLFKYLPTSPELERVIEVDNENYDLEPDPPKKLSAPKNLDGLKDKLKKEKVQAEQPINGDTKIEEPPQEPEPNGTPEAESDMTEGLLMASLEQRAKDIGMPPNEFDKICKGKDNAEIKSELEKLITLGQVKTIQLFLDKKTKPENRAEFIQSTLRSLKIEKSQLWQLTKIEAEKVVGNLIVNK